MKGKLKWIILIVAIIIIAVIGAIIIANELGLQYEIEEIKEYNYFLLTKDSKYGVIDKSGNIIIEPKYIAIQIPNPSKPIFICISNYDQKTETYETEVFNEKGEEIFTDYQNVQAITIDTNIESNPYEKSVLLYKKDGKYGLITLEEKVVTKPIYDEVSSINYKEGTFLVKKDGKAGVINMKGKVIIKNEYETITSDNYYNETTKNKTTGFIVSKKTENGFRYGYINYRGRTILKTEYTELKRVTQIPSEKDIYFIAFKDGQAGLLKNKKIILNHEYQEISYYAVKDIFITTRNGKQGVVTRNGETILHSEYDSILFGGIYLNAIKDNETYVFDTQGNKIETKNVSLTQTDSPNYYIAIDENDIYTVINANGDILIDDNYTYIGYLPGNYFIVSKDGKNGIVDHTGKIVLEMKYTSIFRFNDTNLVQAEIANTKTIELYNLKIQQVAKMDGAVIRQYESSTENPNRYIMLASENNFLYYDENGNNLDAKDIFPNNTLFAKNIDGKWVFVDKEGNTKLQGNYEMITDFNEYGFAGIKVSGKWGVINQNGETVQEPTYELDWYQPSFLGKYYLVNTNILHTEARYSSDEI